MRAAPKGRTHSSKKYIKRFKSKVEQGFRLHSVLFNKYSFKKFKINNKLYLVKQQLKKNNILSITNTVEKSQVKPWYKIFFWKVFAVKKKNLPLVIVSIGHYTYSKKRKQESCKNNAVNNILSEKYGLKMEYLGKNKWSTLRLSNREQKLKSLKIQPFQQSYEESAGVNGFSNCKNAGEQKAHCQSFRSSFGSLSRMEKKNIISQQLDDEKIDVIYNFFYGTSALKAVCIPFIAATPTDTTTSSNEFPQRCNKSSSNEPSQTYNKSSPFAVAASKSKSKTNVDIVQVGSSFTILLPQQRNLNRPENRVIKSQLRKSLRMKAHESRHASHFFQPSRKKKAPKDAELEAYPSNYLRRNPQYDPFK